MSSAVGDSTRCLRGLLQSTPLHVASTHLAVVRFFLRVEQLLDCSGLYSEAVLCFVSDVQFVTEPSTLSKHAHSWSRS